jgi:hypothetical protein
MSTATMKRTTPLAEAERALAAADAEVRRVQRDNAPVEKKFSDFQVAYDEANGSLGHDSKPARTALAGMAALRTAMQRGRAALDVAQRNRSVIAERVESEQRAIQQATLAIRLQVKRTELLVTGLSEARRLVAEKEAAVDTEERVLRQLRLDLAVLLGTTDQEDQ